MPKPLLRLIALLLVPCLIADPASASAVFRPLAASNSPTIPSPLFRQQTLTPSISLGMLIPLSPSVKWENIQQISEFLPAADVSLAPGIFISAVVLAVSVPLLTGLYYPERKRIYGRFDQGLGKRNVAEKIHQQNERDLEKRMREIKGGPYDASEDEIAVEEKTASEIPAGDDGLILGLGPIAAVWTAAAGGGALLSLPWTQEPAGLVWVTLGLLVASLAVGVTIKWTEKPPKYSYLEMLNLLKDLQREVRSMRIKRRPKPLIQRLILERLNGYSEHNFLVLHSALDQFKQSDVYVPFLQDPTGAAFLKVLESKVSRWENPVKASNGGAAAAARSEAVKIAMRSLPADVRSSVIRNNLSGFKALTREPETNKPYVPEKHKHLIPHVIQRLYPVGEGELIEEPHALTGLPSEPSGHIASEWRKWIAKDPVVQQRIQQIPQAAEVLFEEDQRQLLLWFQFMQGGNLSDRPVTKGFPLKASVKSAFMDALSALPAAPVLPASAPQTSADMRGWTYGIRARGLDDVRHQAGTGWIPKPNEFRNITGPQKSQAPRTRIGRWDLIEQRIMEALLRMPGGYFREDELKKEAPVSQTSLDTHDLPGLIQKANAVRIEKGLLPHYGRGQIKAAMQDILKQGKTVPSDEEVAGLLRLPVDTLNGHGLRKLRAQEVVRRAMESERENIRGALSRFWYQAQRRSHRLSSTDAPVQAGALPRQDLALQRSTVQKLTRGLQHKITRLTLQIQDKDPLLAAPAAAAIHSSVESAFWHDAFPEVEVTADIQDTAQPLGPRLNQAWEPVIENIVINALRDVRDNAKPAIRIETRLEQTKEGEWQDVVSIRAIKQGRRLSGPAPSALEDEPVVGNPALFDLAEAQNLVSAAGGVLTREDTPDPLFTVRFNAQPSEAMQRRYLQQHASTLRWDPAHERLEEFREMDTLNSYGAALIGFGGEQISLWITLPALVVLGVWAYLIWNPRQHRRTQELLRAA